MKGFSIINEARSGIHAGARFLSIKKAALGQAYHLNLIFAAPSQVKKLNLIYRDKDRSTDILSFPLSQDEGEIYICPAEARKEAKNFGRSYEDFVFFLFIHGCVHLKGHEHGATMESIEAKLRKRFRI